MREVADEGIFAAPKSEFFWGPSSIHSDCQKRLLDLELNLDDGVTTFNTLLWALSELERIEGQLRHPNDDRDKDKADEASRSRGLGGHSTEVSGVDDRAKDQTHDSYLVSVIRGLALGGPMSSTSEGEKNESSSAGAEPGREQLDEMLMPSDKNYIPCSRDSIHEPRKGDFDTWRTKLNLGCGKKRKSVEDESGFDGEKRPRVTELSRALKDAVKSAVGGEAGNQMSDRIKSRLELPECVSLTNLVSHCLLVSLDQTPADSVRESLAGTIPAGVRARTETASSCSGSGEWMWLHRWFIRNVLSGAANGALDATLDWLVAYMSASDSTIIKSVLDDLLADLSNCEVDGYQYITLYIQRTGVLEYAALREPESSAGSLLAMFPPGLPLTSVDNAREPMQDENKRPLPVFHPNIWLGLSVLCPRLFGAVTNLWVPTLSVDVVKAWSFVPRSDIDFIFLPAVWNILGVSASEEPKSRRAWLCAAMIQRLPELAPIASHFVLLLSALCDNSTDHGTSQGPAEVGYYLLGSLYQVLSKHVLPSVLGADRDNLGDERGGTCKVGEDSGVTMFLVNLQEHAHLVWRKALDSYSASGCTCCNVSSTEEGKQPDARGNSGSNDDGKEVARIGGRDWTDRHEFGRVDVRRGCLNRDPLIQLCQLIFLCCSEKVVADLLANATWIMSCPAGFAQSQSLKRMLFVKKMMQLVVGQGRGSPVLELWTQRMTDHLLIASDEQALGKVLAMGQLLDLRFWQVYRVPMENLSVSDPALTVEEKDGQEGSSRNVVWKMLRAELDAKWLPILSLMHRDGAWDLRLAVLRLLQQLPPISSSRSQAVASRLKGVLGLYFSWLETLNGTGDMFLNQEARNQHEQGTDKSGVSVDTTWQYAREMEHMKRIIIKLASCSYPSFTLMVSRLLDFSFEQCPQISTMPSLLSARNTSWRTEPAATPLRTRTSLSVAPLSTGKLDRYGKLTLVRELCPGDERSIGVPGSSTMQLYEENSRIQSNGFSSLQIGERERFGNHSNGGVPQSSASSADSLRKSPKKMEVVGLELGNLLRRTLRKAISQSEEATSPWPCHPLSVMISLMTERLETPHEVLMTMEQYEEVLPKHISSLRHIFLAECFSQNALLMEILELVVKHGENGEVLRCVEFVRVLLADCISRWHSTFRTRRAHSALPPKVDQDEARSRMQVHRLIQLVASAGWLPPSLASSGEIVAVIDGADIADLLLLVWRCMHHSVAFGSKGWGGSSSNLAGPRGSADGQGPSGGNEEAVKEGTYTEWESHYFSILRQNVAQIGPHFAQVYPLRKSI